MKQPKELPLIGLIASKNPVQTLEVTVQSLFRGGCVKVVVVDDGSTDKQSAAVFKGVEKLGAKVIHLKKNVGKSRALRAGFQRLPKKCIIVQTDDDTLAGNLSGPKRLITEGKTDIVDIRLETVRTTTLLGMMQELDYWVLNAVTKRLQSWINARLWLSGASIMYSYQAGIPLLLEPSHSMTEDTEGLYRARAKGYRVRFYAKHDAQFVTMVPEDFMGLHKQWRRWTTGNGQLMSVYGLGGGNLRIAAVNAFAWIEMVAPVPLAVRYGIVSSLLWAVAGGILTGMVGAIRLKRPQMIVAGIFLPFLTALWAVHAFQGLYFAYKLNKSGQKDLTWVPPTRNAILELPPLL
jgi:cellulose synthase/poly-beta-1,6-N-acetylglucosamine synthase-like glycosyltransferase